MKADDLFEAIGRGIVKQLLSVPEPGVTPAPTLPAENVPPEGLVIPPPEASVVIPGEMPTPGFDPIDEPLPGFESVPRATLKEMEAAMERITRGNEPAPGFYRKDDADTSVPLS